MGKLFIEETGMMAKNRRAVFIFMKDSKCTIKEIGLMIKKAEKGNLYFLVESIRGNGKIIKEMDKELYENFKIILQLFMKDYGKMMSYSLEI
jgi:hypothetical protein